MEPPLPEKIELIADGTPYEGWESFQLEWTMGIPYISFQLTTTEIMEPGKKGTDEEAFNKWNFPPGTAIEVYASGTKLIAGLVNVYAPAADAGQHTITVTGTTVGKDYAESSVNTAANGGRFDNMTDTAIAQQLAALSGVSLADVSGSPEMIPKWQVKQGATNFQEAMRILQPRGKTITPMLPSGEMAITSAPPFFFNEGGMLIQGQNIERMSARLSDDGYYLNTVIGQAELGTNQLLNLEVFGISINPTQARKNRVKTMIDQQASTMQLAQKRAAWEMLRSQGRNQLAEITVPGWRDQSGKFWSANSDVFVYAPFLKIDCVMRIEKVVLMQNNSTGTISILNLVDPKAYGYQGQICKSDLGLWNFSWPEDMPFPHF